ARGVVRSIIKDINSNRSNALPVAVFVEFDDMKNAGVGQRYKATLRSKLRSYYDKSKCLDNWIPIIPTQQKFYAKGKKYEIQRTQVPLCLCFAATVHKMQGASVDELVVTFKGQPPQLLTYGLAYVALSRVRSLKGLYLLDFDEQVVRTDSRVRDEYD
ncbi:MAG: hypothetical protein GY795_02520, partial [Desulfobacterales bacterium]|nr:hypothetical protein [Desulfobacterales bacterium]